MVVVRVLSTQLQSPTVHTLVLGHMSAGTVTLKHIYEIAKIKGTDPAFKNMPLDSVCRTVIGSARSMGIKVVRQLHTP